MNKKMYKSSSDKKISGVLAGIANYFGIDSSLVRIGFIVIMIATAIVPCVIGYFLADWILPYDSEFKS